ncbi:uncharacterized protein LTR77_010605 [Saxophila tyrrhenica]|uniref:Uncharacterized protein n=1 Tax=Saxophila tyrrhenica TaxID=1690608 RepID=A0AAV9NXT8_9PEZI|nr:hypothetical protein LTR77_010605 [Saxophila tyrrhenica]
MPSDVPLADELEDLAAANTICALAEFDDHVRPDAGSLWPEYLTNLKNAIASAAPYLDDSATIDAINEMVETCAEDVSLRTASSPPSPLDSHGYTSFGSTRDDDIWAGFVTACESRGVLKHQLVKFSGLLDAPAMFELHYPPERVNETRLLSVVEQRNSCLYLYFSKLGLSMKNPEANICWTERFYAKTSTVAREMDAARPYRAVHENELLVENERLRTSMSRHSRYRVKVVVTEVTVKEDIERAQKDKDILFTLPTRDNDWVPIYNQP